MTVLASYRRYTIRKYDFIAERIAFHDHEMLMIIRDTYAEAERDAIVAVVLDLPGDGVPVRFFHKPHKEESNDPFDLIGSWGWKTINSEIP